MTQETHTVIRDGLNKASGYYLAKGDKGGGFLVAVLGELLNEQIRLGGGIQNGKTAVIVPVATIEDARVRAVGENYILFVIEGDEAGEPMFAFYNPAKPGAIRQITSAAV